MTTENSDGSGPPLDDAEDQPARRPRAKRNRVAQREQARRQRAARGPDRTQPDQIQPDRTHQDRPHPEPAAAEAWNRLLRRRFRRAAVAAVVWFLVVAGTFAGISVLTVSADRLLAHGTEVAGTVVGVHTPRGGDGTPTITVDYEVGDVLDEAVVARSSDRAYAQGDRVRVFYDPADPRDMRTADEENLDDGWMGVLVIPLLVAVLACPLMVAFAVCWARRRTAARRDGWEPVTATVVDSSGGYQLLRLDFRGGAHLAARTVAALRGRYSFLRTRPVEGWVSGAGRALVLVLPYGPSGPLPYAIPLRVSRGSRRTAAR
ncbi:DUF3592 domain-containing protein [Amycolatopsis sp. NPDC005232]|uniref:DUF3592 domain-containing protein n=1 Tax=Amycolatopsis sp. NPDC005232 TaxID=3157027 RepID=UPI0033AEEB58